MNLSQKLFRQTENKMTPTYESFLLLHHSKWKYKKLSNKTKQGKYSFSTVIPQIQLYMLHIKVFAIIFVFSSFKEQNVISVEEKKKT